MESRDRTRKIPEAPLQLPHEESGDAPGVLLSPRPPPALRARVWRPRCSKKGEGWGSHPVLCHPASWECWESPPCSHLLPFPTVWSQPPGPSHTPPPSPGWRVLDWDVPGRSISFGGIWVARVILTKKSKLKRKRKYLVTLMQDDPILLVWELAAEKAGRSARGGTWLGAGERRGNQCWWVPQTHRPQIIPAHHPQLPHEVGTKVRSCFKGPGGPESLDD